MNYVRYGIAAIFISCAFNTIATPLAKNTAQVNNMRQELQRIIDTNLLYKQNFNQKVFKSPY